MTIYEQESPRDCCAGLAQIFRALGTDKWADFNRNDFLLWASRLEDACRKLDVLEHERGRLENVWRDADARADAAEAEQVRLSVQLTQRARDLEEALIWCSGSPSFAPEGEAREGWLKLCAPLLGSR